MINPFVYKVSRSIGKTIARVFQGWRVEGELHAVPEGPFILAANHMGIIDPWLVGCITERPVYFMAKEELFRIPVLRQWLRLVGSFPVRRGEGDREAIRIALDLLSRGEIVGIFVEGTRNPEGRPLPIQHGAAMLAVRAGVPILPVAMTRDARGRLTRVGTPIHVPKDAGGAARRRQYEEISNLLGEAIARLKGSPIPSVNPSQPQQFLSK